MRIQKKRRLPYGVSPLVQNTQVSVVMIVNALIAASRVRVHLPEVRTESDFPDLLDSLSLLLQKYRNSGDASGYTEVAQIEAVLKKYPFKVASINPLMAGKEKFFQAEEQCRTTNLRLRQCRFPAIDKMREIISDILGPLSIRKIQFIESLGHFGPGSTLSHSRGKVTGFYKFLGPYHTVTTTAKPYAMYAMSRNPRWMDHLYRTIELDSLPPTGHTELQKELIYLSKSLSVQDVERISFVPKTYKVMRPIGVGASMNSYWQLGINTYLERKLKRLGVDLSDQTKNQRLARAGSVYNSSDSSFCTIDLASASDTISYELVKSVLPSDWFSFLSDFRAPYGLLDGQKILYEKFSAMGNGYTFSLESLIFYAATRVAHEMNEYSFNHNDFAIYGDDIIVRKRAFSATVNILRECGFSINVDKTFSEGSFRESCGADYIDGTNVRPIYLTDRLSHLKDVYHFANRMNLRYGGTDMAHLAEAVIRLLKSRIGFIRPSPVSDLYSGLCIMWKDIPSSVRKTFVKSKNGNSFILHSTICFQASSFREDQRTLCWYALNQKRAHKYSPWDEDQIGRKDRATRRATGKWIERQRIIPSWDFSTDADATDLIPFVYDF